MRCVHCSQESEFDAAYCRFCGAPVGGAAPFSRRLLRRPDEGQVAGVCAGIAHYLKVDVTVVRLLWVFLTIVPGAIIGGVIARYNTEWLIERLGHRTPAMARQELLAPYERPRPSIERYAPTRAAEDAVIG